MNQPTNTMFPRTIGMDLGSKKTAYCIVSPTSERLEESELGTGKKSMRAFFSSQPASRVVMEASAPSRWSPELAAAHGHEVVVATPREFKLISHSHRKTDQNDARVLADFGQFRPQLLKPVKLRGLKCQLARTTVAARSQLVEQRTLVICFFRAQVRNVGESMSDCPKASFHKTAPAKLPACLRPSLTPMLEVLQGIVEQIAEYDKMIEHLCEHEVPETKVLRQVPGVGPNTSLSFVAAIEDPPRFAKSREVGPYVGLVSKSRSSGQSNPQLPISKRGDAALRRLLVTSATYIVGPHGQDTDLKRFGERTMARGDQASRAKASIASARKLSVLLHRLLVTGEICEPLRNSEPAAA